MPVGAWASALERRVPHRFRGGEVGAEEVEGARSRPQPLPSGSKKGRRRTRAFSKEPFTLIRELGVLLRGSGGTQAIPIARPR